MLAGLVDYVMVGHSERRRAGETDEQVARKVAAVAANAMTPILFVGEDEQWLTDTGAQRPAIIYGGTVTADNVGQFTAIDVLDGVGATRATLDEHGS